MSIARDIVQRGFPGRAGFCFWSRGTHTASSGRRFQPSNTKAGPELPMHDTTMQRIEQVVDETMAGALPRRELPPRPGSGAPEQGDKPAAPGQEQQSAKGACIGPA
jgi:hypothetical protein